jgi:hypothetical protein
MTPRALLTRARDAQAYLESEIARHKKAVAAAEAALPQLELSLSRTRSQVLLCERRLDPTPGLYGITFDPPGTVTRWYTHEQIVQRAAVELEKDRTATAVRLSFPAGRGKAAGAYVRRMNAGDRCRARETKVSIP